MMPRDHALSARMRPLRSMSTRPLSRRSSLRHCALREPEPLPMSLVTRSPNPPHLPGAAFARLCLLPLALVAAAFFVLPMAQLMIVGASGDTGLAAYAAILTEPRYRATLINTVLLAAATTVASLVIATIAGLFLQR